MTQLRANKVILVEYRDILQKWPVLSLFSSEKWSETKLLLIVYNIVFPLVLRKTNMRSTAARLNQNSFDAS